MCRARERGDKRRGALVSAESIIAALVSVALVLYLLYTLLHPEEF